MILTDFPLALDAMSRPRTSARSSILAEEGTEAVITSIPFARSASVIPRQYCTPGRREPANRSSSNPKRPCARTIGCLGVAGGRI
jgi:hypothetical protein